jgi:methyltransferase (TIGR00027 family)
MSSSKEPNTITASQTSLGSANARAFESVRPNALFQDPFASIYANDPEPPTTENFIHIDGTTVELMITNLAVRTRYFDDLLEKMLNTVKQVVILGCGGDFRPYRLSLARNSPNVKFYLLDVPEVLAYRQECLEKVETLSLETSCKVVEIACNLTNEEWPSKLYEHGFNPDNPTFWLAEGLLPYFNLEEIRRLCSQIRELSTKGSHIVFDLVSTRYQKLLDIIHFALDNEEEVHQIFTNLGCEDIVCLSYQKVAAIYERSVSNDVTFIVNANLSCQNVSSKY